MSIVPNLQWEADERLYTVEILQCKCKVLFSPLTWKRNLEKAAERFGSVISSLTPEQMLCSVSTSFITHNSFISEFNYNFPFGRILFPMASG